MTQNTVELQQETVAEIEVKQEIQTEDKSNSNAFSIKPAKGASLETIKSDLKKRGCHHNLLTKVYTCPISSKSDVEKLLESEKIKASLHDTFDAYHEKSKNGKVAENIWVKVDILEQQYQREVEQLIIDEEILCKEIQKRELLEEDPGVVEKRKKIDERKQKQEKLKEEIEQLRNSATSRENADKSETKKMFRCGNYRVDGSGLYYDPIDKKDDDEAIWISSPLWPEAYLRDKEGKSHTLLLKLHDGEREHFWAMPRRLINKLGDLNDILLDFGLRTPITPFNQKHLQAFLMQARPDKKMRCVDKSGWHQEQYVFPDGLVIGNGKEREGVFPVNDVCPKGIGQIETLTEWQENVFGLCIGNSRLIFCVGTSFASTCLQLIGEDSGGFNFKGRSSIGKTKCLKVAVSVIGSPDYKRSWKTTANGLEGVCALHNDSLLPLDEFGQSDAKESGEIAYMVSAGMGKQRASRDGTARDSKTWRVMILSTGEVGLEEHMREGKKKVKAGQLARVVDIPAEIANGYGCFETIHGYRDGGEFADKIDNVCAKYYGKPIRAFIQRIVEYGIDNARQDLRFAVDDFVADNAKDCDGQVKRVSRRFGSVYAALLLAMKLDVLGVDVTEAIIKNAVAKCYNDWLGERGTSGDMESHSLIEQVKGLLNENADGKFIATKDLEDKRLRSTIWGYKNGSIFYVLPKAFKENLCEGYDSKQAAKILIEKGLLIPGNDGKSGRVERIPAHHKATDRFYVIDLNSTNE